MRGNKRTAKPDYNVKPEYKPIKKIKTEKDDLSDEGEDDYGDELSRENDSCMQSSVNSGTTPRKIEFGQDQYYDSNKQLTQKIYQKGRIDKIIP